MGIFLISLWDLNPSLSYYLFYSAEVPNLFIEYLVTELLEILCYLKYIFSP